MENIVSRRAVFGALAIVPIASVAATATGRLAVDRTAWRAAVAREQMLYNLHNAHPAHAMRPTDVGQAEAEADEQRVLRSHVEAEQDLFATPAPDLAATLEKVEIYLKRYDYEDHTGAIAAIAADLRRVGVEVVR